MNDISLAKTSAEARESPQYIRGGSTFCFLPNHMWSENMTTLSVNYTLVSNKIILQIQM